MSLPIETIDDLKAALRGYGANIRIIRNGKLFEAEFKFEKGTLLPDWRGKENLVFLDENGLEFLFDFRSQEPRIGLVSSTQETGIWSYRIGFLKLKCAGASSRGGWDNLTVRIHGDLITIHAGGPDSRQLKHEEKQREENAIKFVPPAS